MTFSPPARIVEAKQIGVTVIRLEVNLVDW